MTIDSFECFLGAMSIVALFVFVALYFIKAGYGIFRTSSWGPSISNRTAWIIMESPVFFVMLWLWINSDRRFSPVELTFFILFQLHYFQRSFIFPFLMTGKSKMPLSIMLMGVIFNVLNGFMQGEWIFYLSPIERYNSSWFGTPMFIVGTIIFFAGMLINLHSDNVIRHLRKPGDARHYLPAKGLYKYVTSANYFGEIIEWGGWALLTFSWSGLVFFWWTFANLVPRANAIYGRYRSEFGDAVGSRKRVFPYIY